MRQDELSPATGSRRRSKRIGRGDGSGHGTYSGRGCKGQNSRSGSKRRPGLQGGGSLPQILRLPQKRGFTNIFTTRYSPVNLKELAVFSAGSEVTPERMYSARLVGSRKLPVKILATGDLGKSLHIKAHKFSAAARIKIEAAGGTAEEIEHAQAG